MIDHPDLPHFPSSDPPPKTEKESLRAKINKQVQEYLAKGKTIDEVDHTANATFGQPIKRSRKDQVNVMRGKKLPKGFKPPEIKRQKG